MSLRFSDSADHYTSDDVPRKWTAYTGTAPVVTATNAHTVRCIEITGSLTKSIGTSETSGHHFGAHFVISNLGGIDYADDSSRIMWAEEAGLPHFDIRVSSTGKLGLFSQGVMLVETDVGAISSGVMFHAGCELITSDSPSGQASLYLNGVFVDIVTGVDTRNGGAGDADAFTLQSPGSSTIWVDNVVFGDMTNPGPTTFLGEVVIDCVRPNADGSVNDGVPSTGSRYQAVGETQLDNAAYVTFPAGAGEQSFEFSALPSRTGSIHAVVATMAYDKNATGAAPFLYARARSPSTSGSLGSFIGVFPSATAGVSVKQMPSYIDPSTGVAWEEAGVNAAEVGILFD
jgi:hypothetical protein